MVSSKRVRQLLADPTLTDEQIADIQIFTRMFAEIILSNMRSEMRNDN